MNITIISGSTRQASASDNVSNHLLKLLSGIDATTNSQVLSLSKSALPMWDENTDLTPLSDVKQQLENSDGFVFVVPEWHGMVPPAVKNLFFLFSGVFRHKPAYLVTVSSGTGGRYPIQEMRSTTYKNSYLNYIPVNTVIDRVNSVIDNNGDYISDKAFVKNRLDEGLRVLLEYSKAFVQIRQSDIVSEKRFPNGV